jgi:hypothetical protein
MTTPLHETNGFAFEEVSLAMSQHIDTMCRNANVETCHDVSERGVAIKRYGSVKPYLFTDVVAQAAGYTRVPGTMGVKRLVQPYLDYQIGTLVVTFPAANFDPDKPVFMICFGVPKMEDA